MVRLVWVKGGLGYAAGAPSCAGAGGVWQKCREVPIESARCARFFLRGREVVFGPECRGRARARRQDVKSVLYIAQSECTASSNINVCINQSMYRTQKEASQPAAAGGRGLLPMSAARSRRCVQRSRVHCHHLTRISHSFMHSLSRSRLTAPSLPHLREHVSRSRLLFTRRVLRPPCTAWSSIGSMLRIGSAAALLAVSARTPAARHGVIRSLGVSVSDAFDSGNIERVDAPALGSMDPAAGETLRLRIKPDPFTELEQKSHMQWFAFRATLAPETPTTVTYNIENAGECSFAVAFKGAEVVASTDRSEWRRVSSTRYDETAGTLQWEWTHRPGEPTSVYFAYFDTYSYERHLDFVARCTATAGAHVASLGRTLDGREIECIRVGTGPLQAWVIHRQHPGESMASFFAEGLLGRLLGLDSHGMVDGLVKTLLKQFTFHIVPNMNPDGGLRGHLRVNAAGANLNREWASTGDYVAPTLHRSPEVYHTLAAMDASGVDVFVDVHGDEALPFGFIAGAEGLDTWGPRLRALQGAFVGAYARANPDMQAKFGYEPDAPLQGNLAICSNQVAHRFDCLGVTLEMPFKDSAAVPRDEPDGAGFDGRRASMLGRSLCDAIAHVASQLRDVPEPHFCLEDDRYVAPVEDEAAIAEWVAQGRANGGRCHQTPSPPANE